MVMKRYRVTGEYVNVKTNTDMGPMVVGLYKGNAVPEDAAPWWIDHHLANHLIEEVLAPAPPPEPEPKPAVKAAASHPARGG